MVLLLLSGACLIAAAAMVLDWHAISAQMEAWFLRSLVGRRLASRRSVGTSAHQLHTGAALTMRLAFAAFFVLFAAALIAAAVVGSH